MTVMLGPIGSSPGSLVLEISSIEPDSCWDRGRRRRRRADPFRKKEVVYANGENSVPMIKTTWRRGKGGIYAGWGGKRGVGKVDTIYKPVFERLRQLNVPEKSRVWWCPTSAFCSLPLHALGPIPSDDSDRLYFMDLYVCSYAPTLSALIESRKPGSQPETLHKPSLRLVAQPETLHGAQGEINVVQAVGSPVTTLVSEMATPMIVVESLRDHRLVHFVCHGLLETADRRQHFRRRTAPCGCNAILWLPERDRDDVGDGRYGRGRLISIFSESTGRRGVPYYERSARALQFAVKKLRKKRGITLERWANFVHYGA
ncbi:hypothetical protein EDB84DRAFT_1673780 [Lactarius hengduanensis]|nr:hypothetical protein EDB84DRAFT_1673780 [Lactarius hengduanensis]